MNTNEMKKDISRMMTLLKIMNNNIVNIEAIDDADLKDEALGDIVNEFERMNFWLRKLGKEIQKG